MPETPDLTVLRREIRQRWFAGQTSDEIAAALGVDAKTVRQAVNRADRSIADEYARERLYVRRGTVP